MPRSSESVAALASALAKAQAELTNPEKSLVGDPAGGAGTAERTLPLCPAVRRPRHRSQDAGPARDRDHPVDRHRPRQRHHQAHHHAGACVGRMDCLGLAGLCAGRPADAASHGSGADLRPPLCAVHAGRHRRRGRSRCAGYQLYLRRNDLGNRHTIDHRCREALSREGQSGGRLSADHRCQSIADPGTRQFGPKLRDAMLARSTALPPQLQRRPGPTPCLRQKIR